MLRYGEFFEKSFSNLENADLLGAEFTECNFDCANLKHAYITGATFRNCSFVLADFEAANIFCSRFENCDLTGASFSNTLLSTVEFKKTTFSNVCWQGTIINSPPFLIQGIEYPITALDNGYMQVGCEFNTYDWFWNTDEKHSASMEGLRARRFWKRNKQWIFDALKARGLYDYTRVS